MIKVLEWHSMENFCFPPDDWYDIYTDGSLLDFFQSTGVSVFSELFSFTYMLELLQHSDVELEAIYVALQQHAVYSFWENSIIIRFCTCLAGFTKHPGV